jgi:multicomponent Na+:H+ antiporter subunit E
MRRRANGLPAEVSAEKMEARADTRRIANNKVPVTLFVLLLLFWFVLSDQYNLLFVAMGVGSAALVTWLTAPMVDDVVGIVPHPIGRLPLQLWRFAEYLAWVLWRVLVSAIQVAWIVVNPKVHPAPRMLRFRTNMESGIARVFLANTISLVPGTLTVSKEGQELLVHALVPEAVDDLLDGRMQTRIARIFFEAEEQAIDPRWEDPPVLLKPSDVKRGRA